MDFSLSVGDLFGWLGSVPGERKKGVVSVMLLTSHKKNFLKYHLTSYFLPTIHTSPAVGLVIGGT